MSDEEMETETNSVECVRVAENLDWTIGGDKPHLTATFEDGQRLLFYDAQHAKGGYLFRDAASEENSWFASWPHARGLRRRMEEK